MTVYLISDRILTYTVSYPEWQRDWPCEATATGLFRLRLNMVQVLIPVSSFWEKIR
ncbi:hypothetical protein KsCSTR_39240 [Candidatus Kuenenia stuttgartiensis]|uniref:Uncharacterized protein n=1 Tax=Kuenenia stuttgartiensis TaxID=174633 RepID=Q1PUL8_KUEST|nr:hypothetical protein KsCSTR_39240 [Candidatus Kuenenia stuttgartiensis]CAJ70922.1 unknown protein [Candidatus Kuenenia stuttgartiensis]